MPYVAHIIFKKRNHEKDNNNDGLSADDGQPVGTKQWR